MKLEQKHIDNAARWFQTRQILWNRAKGLSSISARSKAADWVREKFPVQKQSELLNWLAPKLKKSPKQTFELLLKHNAGIKTPGIGIAIIPALILAGVAIVGIWRIPDIISSILNYTSKRAADEIREWNSEQKKLFESGNITRKEYLESTRTFKATTTIDRLITFGGLGILAYFGLKAIGLLKKRSRTAQDRTS